MQQGSLQRQAVFKPVTGLIEQMIFSSRQSHDNLPMRVSRVLSFVLQSIGEKPVDMSMVSSLCVADRQYLMICLARLIGSEQHWLQGKCNQCNENFDVNITQSELPMQEAGADFPFTLVKVQDRTVTLRVPTGADQECIHDLDNDTALKRLLKSCIVAVEPEIPLDDFIDSLNDTSLKSIDAALDEVSPSISTVIATTCPECQSSQTLNFDPYHIIQYNAGSLYQEVHRIAAHYHWGENEILNLPKERRQLYLRLIDSSLGMHG